MSLAHNPYGDGHATNASSTSWSMDATPALPQTQSDENAFAAFEHISVIGLGYIGLPTAAMFARRGLKCRRGRERHVVETINGGGSTSPRPSSTFWCSNGA